MYVLSEQNRMLIEEKYVRFTQVNLMKYRRPHPSPQEIGGVPLLKELLSAREQSVASGWEGGVCVTKQDNTLTGNYDTVYSDGSHCNSNYPVHSRYWIAFYDYNHSKKDKYKVISIQSY